MISSKMQEALNAQVNAEMWSAYLYLSMSMDSTFESWSGAAHWFRKQYEEEIEHAFKLIDYMQKQSMRVDLRTIDCVPTEWESYCSRFESALAHEKKVTNMINNIYSLAVNEKDYATLIFIQWFVTEQIEEEENVKAIIDKLNYIGNDCSAMLMLESELSKR